MAQLQHQHPGNKNNPLISEACHILVNGTPKATSLAVALLFACMEDAKGNGQQ
jgi:hypothetical protein